MAWILSESSRSQTVGGTAGPAAGARGETLQSVASPIAGARAVAEGVLEVLELAGIREARQVL